MLHGEGGSDSAMAARVRCGCAWKKFRERSGVLTRTGVPLKLKGKAYATCVRSAMIYESKTWVMDVEQQLRLERVEM